MSKIHIKQLITLYLKANLLIIPDLRQLFNTSKSTVLHGKGYVAELKRVPLISIWWKVCVGTQFTASLFAEVCRNLPERFTPCWFQSFVCRAKNCLPNI